MGCGVVGGGGEGKRCLGCRAGVQSLNAFSRNPPLIVISFHSRSFECGWLHLVIRFRLIEF